MAQKPTELHFSVTIEGNETRQLTKILRFA